MAQRLIRLIADVDLVTESGQRVRKGETFTVAPIEAAVLAYRKVATLAPREPRP